MMYFRAKTTKNGINYYRDNTRKKYSELKFSIADGELFTEKELQKLDLPAWLVSAVFERVEVSRRHVFTVCGVRLAPRGAAVLLP